MKKLLAFTLALLLLVGVCSLANADAPANANPLSDVRVRQALAYAIDMNAINEGLFDSKVDPADSLMPNDDWKVAGLNQYEYNPEKAKELLAAANWDPEYTLDVVYYYGDQLTVDLMAVIQQYFADVGVKMTSRKLEGDLGLQLWTKPEDPINGPRAVDWDLAYAAKSALSAHDYYYALQTGYTGNSYHPGDPEFDRMILEADSTADVAKQKEIFAQIEKYENEVLPMLPLYYQPIYIMESNRLDRKGAAYGNEQYHYDWDITTWDIQPNADGKKVMRANFGPMEFFEHPWFNPGLSIANRVLYDRLLLADGALSYKEPLMASKLDISDDQMSYAFTLRDGIKWHDGEPITPEDIKWSFEYVTKIPAVNSTFMTTVQKLKGYKEYTEGTAEEISGIVIDGNVITFNFESLDANALITFSQMPPLPKKYFADTDPLQFQQSTFFQSPVGSGPYKIKEVKMGDYTVMVPFEDYHAGKAVIEEINLYPSGESDPNLTKNAAAQQLDYAYSKSIEDVLAVEKMDHMKITAVTPRYTRYIIFNQFPRK